MPAFPLLAATAWLGSDEFYGQTEFAHNMTTYTIGGALLIGGIALTPVTAGASLIGALWGAGGIIGSGIILPAITSEIHEYFHPHPHHDHITLVGHHHHYDSVAV